LPLWLLPYEGGLELVERGVFVVELDLGHLEAAAPLGLVPQTILERTALEEPLEPAQRCAFVACRLGGAAATA
jgi:hypothetical protein